MNNVGSKHLFEAEQPFSGLPCVLPRIFHPFKLEVALSEMQPGNNTRLPALLRIRWGSHDCQHHFDPVKTQCVSQFERVSPHAAETVAGHEYSPHRQGCL